MDRVEFLSELIGKPWKAGAHGPDAFDCWHLCQYVKRNLFQGDLPDIDVPRVPTWPWIIEQFKTNEELKNWKDTKYDPTMPITFPDGTIVLMSRLNQPAHAGIWFRPEMKILHCAEDLGVMFQDVLSLKVDGWAKLRFYERA